MHHTLAIHWAATTHGTWLHGNPRGSWRDGRLTGPDPYLEAETRERLIDDEVHFDVDEQSIVANEFEEAVRQHGHRVFAATIQATHVHLILAPIDEPIDMVIARLKYRSARAVLAHRRKSTDARPAETAVLYSRAVSARSVNSRAVSARRIHIPRSVWTIGQCPVFIFNDQHLANAIEYVRDHNRRRSLAADPFDWIDALYPPPENSGERIRPTDVCEQLWT